jgi:flagella basal body P-ring formation protein FlgA
MLEEVSRPTLGLDPQAVSSLNDVVNAEATRDLPAGQVVRSNDIRRAVLVKQGQSALMTVGQGKGFEITVRVEAMQDGRMGEQIRLKNTESGRLLTGTVTGPGAVRGF